MTKMIASGLYYGNGVQCDKCSKVVQGRLHIYHCEQSSPSHPQGYDICENCAKKEKKSLV